MIVSIFCLCVCSTRAQDKIYLRRDGISDVFLTGGEVLEFTGRAIRYKTPSGVREEPFESVVKVETTYPEAFPRGQQQFDAGNYDIAATEWTESLRGESRGWVQREIRSWLVRCAWRRGDWTSAGEQFLAIVDADPATPYWSVAPLIWCPTSLSERDRAAAREWLSATTAEARLLGASFLLTDATLGDAAARTLEDLLRDLSLRVSGLARAQLWRRRTGTVIGDAEIANWRSHLGSLPATCRGGPQYLLGRALTARREFELGAAELLWVPLVYHEHEPTAARASLEAAEALLHAGRRDDARRLFAETADRFPWSVAAGDARSRLAQIDQ